MEPPPCSPLWQLADLAMSHCMHVSLHACLIACMYVSYCMYACMSHCMHVSLHTCTSHIACMHACLIACMSHCMQWPHHFTFASDGPDRSRCWDALLHDIVTHPPPSEMSGLSCLVLPLENVCERVSGVYKCTPGT